MASISSCSAETLAEILLFVSAEDVFNLISCGNRAVSRIISALPLRLRSKRNPLGKFPFSAFKLLRLTELSVQYEKYIPYYPLQLDNRPLSPNEPIKSLETIKFCFAQSFAIFKAGPPLSLLYPNLTSLYLSHSTDRITEAHFEGLPPNLRHFTLITAMTGTWSAPTLPYTVLLSLPDGLETLQIEYTVIKDAGDHFSRLRFPPDLTRLILTAIESDSALKVLPLNLEYLDISFYGKNVGHVMIHSSCFPSTLESIQIQAGYNSTVRLDAPLPSNLKTFHCVGSFSEEDMKTKFPSSLTSCQINTPRITEMPNIGTLLPNQSDVWLTDSTPQDIILPPNLKSFVFNGRDSHLVPIASIPHNITYFRGTLSLPEQLLILPSTLREITIFNIGDGNTAPISLAAWKRLASTLKSLTLSVDMLESVESLKVLDGTLKTLLLLLPGTSARFDFISAPILPSSVTKLTLEGRYGDDDDNVTDWTAMLTHLQILPKLRKLSVRWGSLEHPPTSNHLNEYLKVLPRTLTQLETQVLGGMEIDTFSHLPRPLKSLLIHVISEKNGELSNQHFSQLPSSLTHLYIEGGAKLTAAIYEVIPPTILRTDFSIGMGDLLHGMSEITEEALNVSRTRYYSSPIWQGCPIHG
jgi:hypothetical protein